MRQFFSEMAYNELDVKDIQKSEQLIQIDVCIKYDSHRRIQIGCESKRRHFPLKSNYKVKEVFLIKHLPYTFMKHLLQRIVEPKNTFHHNLKLVQKDR